MDYSVAQAFPQNDRIRDKLQCIYSSSFTVNAIVLARYNQTLFGSTCGVDGINDKDVILSFKWYFTIVTPTSARSAVVNFFFSLRERVLQLFKTTEL